MISYRLTSYKALFLGLILLCLSSLNAYAAVSAVDRLGFQSPTGFNDVNQLKPGDTTYAFLGLVKADGTQDSSVPVKIRVSNKKALTIQKLAEPKPLNNGKFLANYFFSVPIKAPVGSYADVSVSMTYNKVTYPARIRRFNIVDEISQAPKPPAPVVTLQPPVPADPEEIKAARFLEQASFGPTAESLLKVKKLGIDAWLQKQFDFPETTIPDGLNGSQVSGVFFNNMASGKDELRQRVIFALSQTFVVSRNKNYNGEELIPWLRLLSRNAFGNYYTLLKEVTLSPTMGKYLDLANSQKPAPNNKGGANENYPREVLQLFSLGLTLLDQDGGNTLDINGKTQATYEQTTIQQLALALSGWTYPTPPGKPKGNKNSEYFVGPMEPMDQYHDKSAKVLFGGTPYAVNLAANMDVVTELDAVLNAIFKHPNLPPFIATRLIRSLVTSNPSPAYIRKVADVFVNNGKGVRGDLKAVVTAILTDPEARQDTPDAVQGRLKDPVLHILGLTRALDVKLSNPPDQFLWQMSTLGQSPLTPPTVFSYYSPLNPLPDSSELYGPEFQIYTPAQAILRANMIWGLLNSGLSSTTWPFDIQTFVSVAADTNKLIDLINAKLFQGRMSLELREILFNTAIRYKDLTSRSRTALYLAAISSEYAVHR